MSVNLHLLPSLTRETLFRLDRLVLQRYEFITIGFDVAYNIPRFIASMLLAILAIGMVVAADNAPQ